MVGMGSVVTRDVPPFSKAFGNPARVRGANVVGMERSGFDASEIDDFVRIYGYEEPLRALLESHSSGALGDAATLWRRYSSVSSDE
jgi:UDP-N-acetylglucosamine acyltransferase